MFNLRVLTYLLPKSVQISPVLQSKYNYIPLNYCRYVTIAKTYKEHNLTSNNSNRNGEKILGSETEQEFLVRAKYDPDSFGNPCKEELIDADDIVEEEFLREKPLSTQKLRTKQYADIIKSYIRMHKIKEALDVLEIRMIKEDRVKPENYIYNLLLGACGRVGYTKKAFSLYNQMKKRDLKVTPGTYTALFNACANSPWPDTDGLTRAKHLYNIMIEKMYEPNDTNYNAMIKAFGRCGDLPTAFQLADEMISKGFQIKDDTINFLLQAAISDKESGFRHALLVWRKVINKNIKPSKYTFNLILRTIRDCGLGDIEVTNDVLTKILNTPLQLIDSNETKLLEAPSNIEKFDSAAVIGNTKNNSLVQDNWTPNLMAIKPHLGTITSLAEIKTPQDRLLLVGGLKGFLDNMQHYNCMPDIKTCTILLDCIPGNLQSENELMSRMKKLNITPDIDFFNMLIKKRSMRFDYHNAREVVNEMSKLEYRPNLLTYGVLALGCKTKREGLELIEEMKSHSYRLNTEILGAMLHQACSHYNFTYVVELMEISIREEVKPNRKFMECLEKFKKTTKDISNDKDHHLYHNKSFQQGHRLFQIRYKTWINEVEVDDTENHHPWTQFRQTNETDSKKYRDPNVRFKARHISKFKIKTSTKRRY